MSTWTDTVESHRAELKAMADQAWQDKRTWLHSLGISDRLIRLYCLDRPMDPLAWQVAVKNVLQVSHHLRRTKSHTRKRYTRPKKGEVHVHRREGLAPGSRPGIHG